MLLTSIIFILALQQISGQYADDPCVLSHDSSPGICKNNNNCPIVNDLLKCKRIRPTMCGFDGDQPIVCCPTNNLNLGNCGSNKLVSNTERVSVRKCREYCESPKNEPEILGGTKTLIGEFPHMAAIGWLLTNGQGYDWKCGGSLISENYVLTAAHCIYVSDPAVQTTQPTIVRLGEYNLKTNGESKIQDIEISSILNHPSHKQPYKYHDIALIRLSRPAVFRSSVRPICLWQTINFPSTETVATGWGRVGFAEDASDSLLKVSLNIIDQKTCADFYSNRKRQLPNGVITEQMCAGDLSGGKDTCQGDSGGPLQIRDVMQKCDYRLIGITSFGAGCGGKNSPGVYTRISSYIDWIESVVWP